MDRRRSPGLAAIAVAFVLEAGCSSVRVVTDWDRQYDFANLHAYSWARTKDSEEAAKLPFLDRRIRQAVDAELSAKGYEARESGGEFLVVYNVNVRDRVNVYSYGPRWNRWHDVDTYKEGTLMIGIVDRSQDEIVWTGYGEGIVSEAGPSEEAVRSAVAKILKEFPPSRPSSGASS
jgi:hypothetical protein